MNLRVMHDTVLVFNFINIQKLKPRVILFQLLEEPAIQLRDLMLSPGNMLHGRGTFLIYLNNMVFRATKGKIVGFG